MVGLQNQRPFLNHSDLILHLMRCIGPSATAEDEAEQLNQHSPGMLKKTRPVHSTLDAADDATPPKQAHDGKATAGLKTSAEPDELEWPVDAEMFGAAEISEMASLLLRMILELWGEAAVLTHWCAATAQSVLCMALKFHDMTL